MTLIANANGEIAGQFTIPADIPAGSKLVEFIGQGGTTAFATFVGRGALKIEEKRQTITKINRRTLTWKGDPLAQTFILDRAQQIAALDLWFVAKGATNVLVQIRDVQLGIPTPEVVTEAILTPAQINVGNWTRCNFPAALLEAGREYAIVVACDDAVSELAVAELGKFDNSAQKWVTSQPYTVGVLLSSSNNRTWTPHQDKDLTFRLVAADYNVVTNDVSGGVVSKEFALPAQTVTNMDHLMVLAMVDRPSADTDVVFELTIDGTVYSVIEGQRLTLPARYSGAVTWKAILTGTETESPALYKDVHLVVGTRRATGDYITRAIKAGAGSKIVVYYEALTPGASTVAVSAESGVGVWTPVPVVSGTPIGDGWVDVKCELTGFAEDETRIKLVLSGTAQARPRVKNLRVVITE